MVFTKVKKLTAKNCDNVKLENLMKVMKVKVSNLHKAAKKHFAQQQWVGVDQSVSLVERCRDLIAKQTIFPNTITGS